MVGSISKYAYVRRQVTYKNVKPDEKTLQACSFTLEEEEMNNWPRPFMRFYQSNETAKSYQQLSAEEQSTKRESSNLQAVISQAQSLNEVMKPIPSIPNSKEEKPQFVLVCNQSEFLVEPNENKVRRYFRSFYNGWNSRGGRQITRGVQKSWEQLAWSITTHER